MLGVAEASRAASRRRGARHRAWRRAPPALAQAAQAQRAGLRRAGRLLLRLPDGSEALDRRELRARGAEARRAARHGRACVERCSPPAAAHAASSRASPPGTRSPCAPRPSSSPAARCSRRCSSSGAASAALRVARQEPLDPPRDEGDGALRRGRSTCRAASRRATRSTSYVREGIMFEGASTPLDVTAVAIPWVGRRFMEVDRALPEHRDVRAHDPGPEPRRGARGARRHAAHPLQHERASTSRACSAASRSSRDVFLRAGAKRVMPMVARLRGDLRSGRASRSCGECASAVETSTCPRFTRSARAAWAPIPRAFVRRPRRRGARRRRALRRRRQHAPVEPRREPADDDHGVRAPHGRGARRAPRLDERRRDLRATSRRGDASRRSRSARR